MTTFLVALFGALGVMLRYRLGLAFGARMSGPPGFATSPPKFPWPTLVVNVSGTFALALLASWTAASRLDPRLSTALSVGLLGGYTTFSAFGWETFGMLREGRLPTAIAYMLVSLLFSLAAAGVALVLVGSA